MDQWTSILATPCEEFGVYNTLTAIILIETYNSDNGLNCGVGYGLLDIFPYSIFTVHYDEDDVISVWNRYNTTVIVLSISSNQSNLMYMDVDVQ